MSVIFHERVIPLIDTQGASNVDCETECMMVLFAFGFGFGRQSSVYKVESSVQEMFISEKQVNVAEISQSV